MSSTAVTIDIGGTTSNPHQWTDTASTPLNKWGTVDNEWGWGRELDSPLVWDGYESDWDRIPSPSSTDSLTLNPDFEVELEDKSLSAAADLLAILDATDKYLPVKQIQPVKHIQEGTPNSMWFAIELVSMIAGYLSWRNLPAFSGVASAWRAIAQHIAQTRLDKSISPVLEAFGIGVAQFWHVLNDTSAVYMGSANIT
ncbi:hypothetical protein FA15DRAFT_708285 [Coprinopsis marcescibilis]|uniref:Uncharacterized protein n=1 Tax=Coprinopsis marcescibilis TaxID=230819 RepID=A0A5C3KJV2_COPMA|nr:hypothetical protein FA15DRAFT_708285 [Coprinopsis marcescibilis]